MLMQTEVLILVLVEDGLVGRIYYRLCNLHEKVLILVLVEDGLVVVFKTLFPNSPSLNPCFSGGWSSG